MPRASIWNAPWADMESRVGKFWGQQVGRSHRYFMSWGMGGAIGALGGGALGLSMGGGSGALAGAAAGSMLGTATTGFQALGFAGAGGLLGYSMGGPAGGFAGAVAGGVFGGIGPVGSFKFGGKQLGLAARSGGALLSKAWKSGKLGKRAVLGGVGLLGAGAMQTLSADTHYSLKANALTAGALAAPLVGVGAGLGIKAAYKGGGLKGFGNALWGSTGSVLKNTLKYTAKHPGGAGGWLGVGMGLWSLGAGVAGMMASNATIGSMEMGTREARYGMDPNNLETQGLTLALHYKHL